MRVAAALAGLALLAVPAAAAAQATAPGVLLGEVKSICVAAQGDGARALALADQSGWSPVPDALLKSMTAKLKNGQGRMKSDAAGLQLMLVGSEVRNLGPLPVTLNLCAVGAGVTDPDIVAGAVKAMAGGGATLPSSGGANLWLYQEDPTGPKAIDTNDPAGALAALKARSVRALVYQTMPNALMPKGLSLVGYAVPTS